MEQSAIKDKFTEKETNGNSILKDLLVNNVYAVFTLIDSRCDCVAAANYYPVRKAYLSRLKTLRKLLEPPMISKI